MQPRLQVGAVGRTVLLRRSERRHPFQQRVRYAGDRSSNDALRHAWSQPGIRLGNRAGDSEQNVVADSREAAARILHYGFQVARPAVLGIERSPMVDQPEL